MGRAIRGAMKFMLFLCQRGKKRLKSWVPQHFMGEGHTEILVETGKLLDLEIAIVTIDTLMKNVERKMLHYLGENEFAGVHSGRWRSGPLSTL